MWIMWKTVCSHGLAAGDAPAAGWIRRCISAQKRYGENRQKNTEAGNASAKKIQLFSSNRMPQFRQLTVILPLPRGTRRYCPQLGHLK